MKAILLFLSLFIATTLGFSQALLQEDFSSGAIPTGWQPFGNLQNFSVENTSNAGGIAPEFKFKGIPEFNGALRFISPRVNTAGHTKLLLSFKQFYSSKGGSFKIAVETRAQTNSPWTEVYSNVTSTNVGPETVTVIIDNSDIGSATFQLCFKVDGNSNAMNYWAIDDVVLTNPLNLDASLASVNIPSIVAGNSDVKGEIANLGLTTINKAKVSYSLDGGDITTIQLSGLNLKTGEKAPYAFADPIINEIGSHILKVWVHDVNDLGQPDDNTSNDTLTKAYEVVEYILTRRPMMEEFTSSTCGPCASFNNSVLNPFIAQHDNDVTLVKYQMNWPGTGDPYYTAEGGVRRSYYGVSGVPDFYVDGKKVGTSTGAVNAAYNASIAKDADIDIKSVHEISGNKVIIDCNLMPYASQSLTMHCVVIERETKGNAIPAPNGGNGETSFKHVMMKMVPNAQGTPVTLTAKTPYNFKQTVDMSGTHVEEMNDLMVAIFLQKSDKDIVNSNYSVETGSMYTMTPANNTTNFSLTGSLQVKFNQAVRNTDGSALTNANLQNVLTLKENNASGADVEFTATIDAAKTTITVQPVGDLKSSQQYYFAIAELENNSGINTLPGSINFTTEQGVSAKKLPLNVLNIYPNPASKVIYLETEDTNDVKRVEIINSIGQLVKVIDNPRFFGNKATIELSNMHSGVYFMKVVRTNTQMTSKFIVK